MRIFKLPPLKDVRTRTIKFDSATATLLSDMQERLGVGKADFFFTLYNYFVEAEKDGLHRIATYSDNDGLKEENVHVFAEIKVMDEYQNLADDYEISFRDMIFSFFITFTHATEVQEYLRKNKWEKP